MARRPGRAADRAQGGAGAGAGAVRSGPVIPASPGCGWRRGATARAWARWRPRPASPWRAARRSATWRCRRWPTDGGETKTGYGVSVGREPADVDLDEAADDAAERATRLLGAVQPASGTVTLVLEPQMAGHPAGRGGRHAQRRVGAQGPVAVRRPGGRGHRLAAGDPGGRPDRPRVAGRRLPRRRGPGHPADPAHRGRGARRLPAQHDDRPAGRGAVDGVGGAGLPLDPGRGRPGAGHHAGLGTLDELVAGGRPRACWCSR